MPKLSVRTSPEMGGGASWPSAVDLSDAKEYVTMMHQRMKFRPKRNNPDRVKKADKMESTRIKPMDGMEEKGYTKNLCRRVQKGGIT